MAASCQFSPECLASHFSGQSLARKSRNKPPRRYYLIVCEGEATEPNYFNSLKLKLPNGMVDRVTVVGEGMNTLSLVNRTVELVEARKKSPKPQYYKVWLVFDRDSFGADNFDNAITVAASKTVAGQCQWRCAWSNEAFELWYLLHFAYYSVPMGRAQYQSKIEECLKGHGVSRTYRKNAADMYHLLEPLQENAIAHAKRLLTRQGKAKVPPSQMNPATTVHMLVEELISYFDA